MASTSKDKWLKFFLDAKIPKSAAEEYTLTFVDNRIQSDMLLDLDKEYLNAMGITVMGDIIAILKHAKVCHVQNAKRNMLSSSSSSLTVSNKPTALSSDNNFRSVSLKRPQPTVAKQTVKTVTKPIVMTKNNCSVKSKSILSTNSTQTKVPIVREGPKTDRNIKINKKPIDIRSEKNIERSNVVEKEVNKPAVRVPLVRKRLSSELLKSTVNNTGKHDHESISSGSETDETVEDITRKMAKKSIFDRLGNPDSKSSTVDSSERAVSSSTSPVTSTKRVVKKVISQTDGAPKPGTLSYRMFPPHVHSTSNSTDEFSDTALDDDGDRILIEIDQARDGSPEEEAPLSEAASRLEYSVALPPDFVPASTGPSAKAGGSVFDRLGGKNKIQSSSSASNPGKSILKISSSSLRISKPSSPINLLPNKRDFKSMSSLSNKLNLIRSQVRTEGVLGKPENALLDKLPAKARIGSTTSTTARSSALSGALPASRTQVPTTPVSSVKNRLTLAGVTESEKKPVFNSKLDVLAKRTLNSTPAHVKARIESEQQKFLSKAKCGSGIKARLGFKTRGEKSLFKSEHDDERRTKSLTPEKSDPVFEREILTNGEEEAEMTLVGKKRVRFHCVEKKLIPNRKDDKLLQRRFSSPLESSRYRTARVW